MYVVALSTDCTICYDDRVTRLTFAQLFASLQKVNSPLTDNTVCSQVDPYLILLSPILKYRILQSPYNICTYVHTISSTG